MIVTPGRLMFNRIVPPELREGDDGTPLNAGRLKEILQQVAEKQPDRYRDISHSILKFGARASTEVSASFGLDDLDSPIDKASLLDGMRKEEDRVFANKKLTRDQRNSELVKIYGTYSQNLPDVVFDAAMQRGSNLAKMVASGARGSKGQLNSNIGADFLMLDADSRPIPVPITSSYAEGLSPAEYYAAAYGTRRGLLSTKLSVAQSGYLSKQLSAAAHDLVVTEKDCTTNRGIPTTPDDKDNIGSVLARPTGGYPAGTVVTGRVLKQLRDTKVNNFIVRSPLTCSAHNGICSTCAGIREKNRFPAIMDTIGLASASSVGEPLSQGTLSEKHCLFEETFVRMADWSVKKIKDIRIGDRVLGANKDGGTFPVQVVNVFENGPKVCWETKFRIGVSKDVRSLVSTLDHKILAKRKYHIRPENRTDGNQKWGEEELIPIGTKSSYSFSAVMPSSFDDSDLVDEQHSLLLGLLIGDGCYTTSVPGGGAQLACCDPLLIEDITPYMTALGYKMSKAGDSYRIGQLKKTKGVSHARGGRWAEHPLKTLLVKLKMYGKYAHQKEIPDEALAWSNKSIAGLIGGIIATDGCVCQTASKCPMIRLSMTARPVVERVKFLLETRFGILGSPVKRREVSRCATARLPIYTFDVSSWSSVKRFHQVVKIPGAKQGRLDSWISTTKLSDREFDSRRATRIEQACVGKLPTWDIQVDHPDHLFVLASGLIVSNSGGVASSSGKAVSAFRSIESLVQIPETFPEVAPVAHLDGPVTKIEDAPQGGNYIHIGGQSHYIPRGRELMVKPGDTVEAGDVLSSGTPNPAEIVRYKGIGSGRLYFVNALRKAMTTNKIDVDRRNLEVLGRSLINHVKVTDPEGYGSFLPDEVAEYDGIERDFSPEKHQTMPVAKAGGQYLARPALHYTIGTRITPSVIKTLNDSGEKDIDVMDSSPGFVPDMQRLADIPGFKADWMAQMAGSGLRKHILKNVHSGDAVSKIHGTSFIPGLAKGTEFGSPPPGTVGW